MAARKNQDFEMYQGDYKTPVFTVTDRNDADVDITSMDLTWTLRLSRDDAAILTKTSAQALELDVSYGATNQFIVFIDPTDTVPAVGDPLDGDYYHEAAVTDDGSGNPQVIAEGTVTIEASAIQ